jgi:alkylation response protein AidB-like acyl-CoA dehydrogenase
MAAIKSLAGDFTFKIADNCMQVFGALGTSADLPIERYWRSSRHTRIGEGSQEMMKFVLARNILRD